MWALFLICTMLTLPLPLGLRMRSVARYTACSLHAAKGSWMLTSCINSDVWYSLKRSWALRMNIPGLCNISFRQLLGENSISRINGLPEKGLISLDWLTDLTPCWCECCQVLPHCFITLCCKHECNTSFLHRIKIYFPFTYHVQCNRYYFLMHLYRSKHTRSSAWRLFEKSVHRDNNCVSCPCQTAYKEIIFL